MYEAPNYVVSILVDGMNEKKFSIMRFQYVTYNGWRVMWDRVYSVKVQVAGDKFGETCGMCGNYNAVEDDDMIVGPSEHSTCTLGDDHPGAPGTPVSSHHKNK